MVIGTMLHVCGFYMFVLSPADGSYFVGLHNLPCVASRVRRYGLTYPLDQLSSFFSEDRGTIQYPKHCFK
jgi:hypothetical protein